MIRFRLYYDKEKETEYLNEMSRKGYAMTGFFAGAYFFTPCEPGQYHYQIDITEGFFRVSNDYREFMKEMDVEILCLWGPWVILRKKASEGPFELYTDVESRIGHYSRIRKTFQGAVILEVLCMFMEAVCALRGAALAWFFFFLLACVLVSLIRELMRVNAILTELKSRQGIMTEEKAGGSKFGTLSGLIPLGLFLNALGFLIARPGENGEIASSCEFWGGFFHGLALVACLAGLVHTWWRKR